MSTRGGRLDADARLRALRRKLDRVDARILALLGERASLALRAAAVKKRAGRPAFDPVRENAVLERVAHRSPMPLRPEHLRAVFTEIISATRALQVELRIACAGPDAARTARTHFGASVRYALSRDAAGALAQIADARAHGAVVPATDTPEGGSLRATALSDGFVLVTGGQGAYPGG